MQLDGLTSFAFKGRSYFNGLCRVKVLQSKSTSPFMIACYSLQVLKLVYIQFVIFYDIFAFENLAILCRY